MILKNFLVTDRIDSKLEFNGMDCHSRCFDKKHFKNFSSPVEYSYNSRGFRDREWPENLDDLKNNVVWCIGDSFTVGIGSPLEHTWPRAIEHKSGMMAINVSMDGASNEWIADRAVELITEINPRFVIIMWSFIHRRQVKVQATKQYDPGQIKQLYSGRTTNRDDVDHFSGCLQRLNDFTDTTVVHTMVPESAPEAWIGQCRDLISQQRYHIPIVQKIDLARDGFHFDRFTAESVALQVLSQISHR